jgi:hypothetical protein
VLIADDAPAYASISPQLAFETTTGADTIVTVVFPISQSLPQPPSDAVIKCKFGTENTTATVINDQTLTCPVPACRPAGLCLYTEAPFQLIVTINDQPTVTNIDFTYVGEPLVTAWSPATGDVRESTVLMLTGSNFRETATGCVPLTEHRLALHSTSDTTHHPVPRSTNEHLSTSGTATSTTSPARCCSSAPPS